MSSIYLCGSIPCKVVGFLAFQLLCILFDIILDEFGRNDSARLLGHVIRILLPSIAGVLLNQSSSNDLAELLGRALAEAIRISWGWNAIHHAIPKELALLIEGFAKIYRAEVTRALRKQAGRFRRLAAAETGSDGSGFTKARYVIFEVLMHFLLRLWMAS